LGEERNMLLRAGRMYLPFGLRMIEHPLYVRTNTGTNIDSQQQLGASFFYEQEKVRFEVMAIAGNYQIAPDDYRQRGYAGYAEVNVASATQVGLSSKVTRAKLDSRTLGQNAVRGAHGPMVRWSPIDHVAVLGELDLLHLSATGAPTRIGMAGMAQIDWELTRGMHTMVTGELYHGPEFDNSQGTQFSDREWLSFAWFAFPHVDLRLDTYRASEVYPPPFGRIGILGAMTMLHVSL
jgi:hypothetical protein